MSTLVFGPPIAQRGMWQQVIIDAITILQPQLAAVPDEDGSGTTAVQFSNEQSARALASPVCAVGVEGGVTELLRDGGRVSFDHASGLWTHLSLGRDCKLVFTLYTALDAVRRYLADYLITQVQTAWATGPYGDRIDGAVLEQLRNVGIMPKTTLFDRVEYPPEDLGEKRPFGLPFRAVVRLNADIQTSWTAPGLLPQAVLALQDSSQPSSDGWTGPIIPRPPAPPDLP